MMPAADVQPGYRRVAAVAFALAVAALLLRASLGSQNFSFYGPALVALLAVVLITPHLFRARRMRQLERWPLIALVLVTVLAATIQIGFWLVFFHGEGAGLGLGLARAMFADIVARIATWLPVALAAAWTALIFSTLRSR